MGRPAGSVNRPKRQLLALLQEKYPNYQPVLEMTRAAVELSKQAEETNEANLWTQASTAHEKVAQYVTPKLKALEVTGPEGGPIEWAELSDDDLRKRAESLAATLGIGRDSK